jgi:hypothetical protein
VSGHVRNCSDLGTIYVLSSQSTSQVHSGPCFPSETMLIFSGGCGIPCIQFAPMQRTTMSVSPSLTLNSSSAYNARQYRETGSAPCPSRWNSDWNHHRLVQEGYSEEYRGLSPQAPRRSLVAAAALVRIYSRACEVEVEMVVERI